MAGAACHPADLGQEPFRPYDRSEFRHRDLRRHLPVVPQVLGEIDRYEEDPQDWELGEWPSPAPKVWEVPVDVDGGALLDGFLNGGVWRLYVAREALPPGASTDAFKGEIAELTRLLESHGVSVFIDAWYDNTEWRIVLTPPDEGGVPA